MNIDKLKFYNEPWTEEDINLFMWMQGDGWMVIER